MHAVVVSEAHLLMRKGMVAFVEQVGSNRVLAECEDVKAAVRLVSDHRPHLLMASAESHPVEFGNALMALKAQRPQMKIMVLCNAGSPEDARIALDAGCEGIVRKDADWQQLGRAVTDVMNDRGYVDPGLVRELMTHERSAASDPVDLALGRLTVRQRTVFALLAEGHTNRSAGSAMGISAKTVEKHRAALMQKLSLRDGFDIRFLGAELGMARRAKPSACGCGSFASRDDWVNLPATSLGLPHGGSITGGTVL